MTYAKTFAGVLLVSLFCLSGIAVAQEAPYTEGSVWAMTFVRVEPGRLDDYFKNLNGMYRKVNEEAKKQGFVLSYKVIGTSASTRDDWNLLILVEFKNWAAFDELNAKFRAIVNKLASEEQQEAGIEARAKIREIIGGKIGRELSFK